jgi:hypothetical protein
MHVYGGVVHSHTGTELDELIKDLESFWAGQGDGQADPHASFDVGELRNDSGDALVMIVEGC